jgi:uncharacterized membrane protein HdeD (DUF308 family)
MGSGTVDIAWWTFLLAGVLSVIFGLVFFLLPGLVSGMSVYVMGLFLLLLGTLNVTKGASAPSGSATSLLLLGAGILMALIGASIFVAPFFFADLLAFIIAVWALIFGAGELALALRNADYGWFRVVFLFTGLISVLLAAVLVGSPLAGELALIRAVGLFAVACGCANIAGAVLTLGQNRKGMRRAVSTG